MLTAVGSFLVDAAIILLGGGFVTLGASMVNNDIKVAKNRRETKKQEAANETESAED